MPKGRKILGSPDCKIDKTFIYQFYFQKSDKKSFTHKKTYRNPIYLAKEYKKMIDSGEIKDQLEYSKLKGTSRAKFTQILNLLKLNKDAIR